MGENAPKHQHNSTHQFTELVATLRTTLPDTPRLKTDASRVYDREPVTVWRIGDSNTAAWWLIHKKQPPSGTAITPTQEFILLNDHPAPPRVLTFSRSALDHLREAIAAIQYRLTASGSVPTGWSHDVYPSRLQNDKPSLRLRTAQDTGHEHDPFLIELLQPNAPAATISIGGLREHHPAAFTTAIRDALHR